MPVIRGFAAAGIVACFDEAPGGGAIFDLNAPRNAPAKYPHLHLDKVTWHSEFEQLELLSLTTVTINHAAVAGSTLYTGIDHLVRVENSPTQPSGPVNAWVAIEGPTVVTDHTLFTHGLGVPPLYLIAWNGAVLVNGTVVQQDASPQLMRAAAGFATASIIGLRELANPGAAGYTLPAASISYDVMVLQSRPQNPALPLFSKAGADVTIGRGRVDTSKQYVRRVLAGESSFGLDLERSVDLANGGYRTVTGGNLASSIFYNGSFAGPAYVPIGV